MAAAILAIKRKNREGGGRRFSLRKRKSIDDDGAPPEWAKNSKCFAMWNRFWSQTTIDEKFWSLQPKAAKLYANPKSQGIVAALIFGNFISNIVEKEIDPTSTLYSDTFYALECFFNISFLIELIINVYAHWFWKFVKSAWNWFDLLVVTIGMMSVLKLTEGPLSLLRNLRAFRVFRLFRRIKSLNKILMALARAVPGVANAFGVLLLVMSIYAILAVEFFRDIGVNREVNQSIALPYGEVEMVYGTGEVVSVMTARGMPYGEEYFGTFFKALYTLFQVLLGDSWSEICARTVMFGYHPLTGSLFFVSFMIVNAVMLTNVALAVLLEKVIEDPEEGKDEEQKGGGDDSTRTENSSPKKGKEEKKDRRKSNSTPDKVLPNDGSSSSRPGSADPDAWVSESMRTCETPSNVKLMSSGTPRDSGAIDRLAAMIERLNESLGEVRGEVAAIKEQQGELLRRFEANHAPAPSWS